MFQCFSFFMASELSLNAELVVLPHKMVALNKMVHQNKKKKRKRKKEKEKPIPFHLIVFSDFPNSSMKVERVK